MGKSWSLVWVTMRPGADYFELADYAGVLRRRWLMVLAFTVVGIALAGAYYYVAPRVYAATALVQVNALQTTANALGGRTSGPVNMDNENQIVQSAAVAAIAKSKLNSALSVADLLKEIKVTVPPNTTFLEITCSAGTADLARRCANAFGRAYLYNRRATALNLITSALAELQAQATTLETSIAQLRAKLSRHGLPAGSAARGVAELQLSAKVGRLSTIQSKISSATPLEANLAAKNTAVGQIVTPAVNPSAPASPKKKLLLPSGMAAGLVLGLAFAFAVDWRRPRIHSARDIQRRVDLPAVFSVDAVKGADTPFAPPRSRAGQAFTEIAQYAGTELGDGHHVLLVTGTSAAPGGSGTSGTIAANVASALARTRGDTVLICADPQGPMIPRLPGSADRRGFAELLAGTATFGDVLRRTADLPPLAVITPGRGADGAVYDLRHDTVQRIIRELRKQARYVIIGVPSPGLDADTFCMAEFADAAILAVPAGTHPAEVIDCVQRLERMRTAPLAAVLMPPAGRSRATENWRADTVPDMAADMAAEEPVPRYARARSGQPVIRPAVRRAPGTRESAFTRDWTPRNVSESWPLPQAPAPEQDEEAGVSDPLIGN